MQETGELAGQGGDRKSKSKPSILKLKDLAISNDESAQAQEFASVSKEAFERMLGESGSGELSDAALLRRIRAAKAESSPTKSPPSKRKPVKAKTLPPTADAAPPPTPSRSGRSRSKSPSIMPLRRWKRWWRIGSGGATSPYWSIRGRG
jgi:hypothetical protein